MPARATSFLIEFFTVSARQLVRTLGHDKLRGKVGAHAGGVDHTAPGAMTS